MLRRSLTLASAGLLLGAAAALALASPAEAHNYLVSSTPVEGATLTELPPQFEITTSDDLLDLGGASGGFALQVVGPDGRYYGDGCVEVSGSSMTSAPALGPAGDYTVVWQVVSADGHTVSDEIPFAWAPSSPASAAGSATPPVCGETATAPSPVPSPAPSDEGSAAPPPTDGATPTRSDVASAEAAGDSSDVLWIGGGVLAVAAAAIITYLVVGRRKSV